MSEGGDLTCNETRTLIGAGLVPFGVMINVSLYVPTGRLVGFTATLIDAGNIPDSGVTVNHWLIGGATVTPVAFDVDPLVVVIVIVCAVGIVVAVVIWTKVKLTGEILKGEDPVVWAISPDTKISKQRRRRFTISLIGSWSWNMKDLCYKFVTYCHKFETLALASESTTLRHLLLRHFCTYSIRF